MPHTNERLIYIYIYTPHHYLHDNKIENFIMAMDLDNTDASTVLATLRSESPDELAGLFYEMEDQWDRKLWHQLTQTLKQFYSHEQSVNLRYRVFTQFISSFEKKINQLAYVQFGHEAAKQCSNGDEAVQILNSIAEKVDTAESQDAFVYAETELARLKLQTDDLTGARELLEKCQKILDQFDSTDPVINATFYSVNSEYFKNKADFTSYYRNALLYLACIDLQQLTITQQRSRAYDLAVAALLGDKVYNFGELLLHPILETLKETEYSWLVDILFALNAGDVKKFEGLSGHLDKTPLLQNSLPFLKQKICLTALIEAVFKRPTSSRVLKFDDIANETHLVKEEVEHLVMKALALGLLQGFIDQVDETVTVTWLQPRVMNKEQIATMKGKLEHWDTEVEQLGQWMHTSGGEIWTQA